jgi:hypothetical protein
MCFIIHWSLVICPEYRIVNGRLTVMSPDKYICILANAKGHALRHKSGSNSPDLSNGPAFF